jgi:hypothetical protein
MRAAENRSKRRRERPIIRSARPDLHLPCRLSIIRKPNAIRWAGFRQTADAREWRSSSVRRTRPAKERQRITAASSAQKYRPSDGAMHDPTAYFSLCPISFRRGVIFAKANDRRRTFLRRGAQKSRACGLLLALLRRTLGLRRGSRLLRRGSLSLRSGLLGSGHFRGSFSNSSGPQAFGNERSLGVPDGKGPLARYAEFEKVREPNRRRAAEAARHPCRLPDPPR